MERRAPRATLMTKKKNLPDKLQAWVEARHRHHLSHAHVQMARELGMNPKKLGKIDNHHHEPWKLPLPKFIEELYEKRFGRRGPDAVLSVEDLARKQRAKKESKKAGKAARRATGAVEHPAVDAPLPRSAPDPALVKKAPTPERADHLVAPVEDYFEGRLLADPGMLEAVIEMFIADVEHGYFQTWEAIELEEHDRQLSKPQQARLDDLVGVGGSRDDDAICDECGAYADEVFHPIRTINGRARPDRPWYDVFREIAAHLLVEPIRTFDIHHRTTTEGWVDMVDCLKEHGRDLSLPASAATPEGVIPPELRHKLWLLWCADPLIGLGQEGIDGLEGVEFRIKDFVDRLKECKESVQHLGLTLDTLSHRIVLPDSHRDVILEQLRRALGVETTTQQIADRL